MELTTLTTPYIVGWLILIFSMKLWNKSQDEIRGCFVISAYSAIGFIGALIYIFSS